MELSKEKVQAYTALYLNNVECTKNEEFIKLYTNDFQYGEVVKERLSNKSEGAKLEVELIDNAYEALGDIKLRLDFEKLEEEINKKRIELEDKDKELIEKGFDLSDIPKTIEALKSQGIKIKSLYTSNLKEHKNNPIVKPIYERMKIQDEISTYENLEKFQEDGFIIPQVRLWGSLSGRIITHSPSTQNFPKYYKDYILPLRENETCYELDIKAAEIVALAYLAKEDEIFRLIAKKKDIYKFMFSSIFGKSELEVTEEQRSLMKELSLAINYGIGMTKIAEIINNSGISKKRVYEEEAKGIKSKYFKLFPNIEEYLEKIKEADVLRTDQGFEIEVEPSYRNMAFPAQNYIATVMKVLLEHLKDNKQQIVNVVHDSLWISIPEGELEMFKNLMEQLVIQMIPEEYHSSNIELVKISKLGGK